jgi:hypothetical protein
VNGWWAELIEKAARQQRVRGSQLDGPTRAELYEQAKAEEIPGRAGMSKEELSAALSERRAEGPEARELRLERRIAPHS